MKPITGSRAVVSITVRPTPHAITATPVMDGVYRTLSAVGRQPSGAFHHHSMGGQTARALTPCCATARRKNAASGAEVAELFKGGKKWTRSITTVPPRMTANSPPAACNCSTLPKKSSVPPPRPAEQQHRRGHDFKLDHRTAPQQRRKLRQLPESGKIVTVLDRRPERRQPVGSGADGARELNQWTKTYPDTYYCSAPKPPIAACSAAGTSELSMFLPFQPLAMFAWAPTPANSRAKVIIDSSWWQNDGHRQHLQHARPRRPPSGQLQRHPGQGQWNHIGLYNSWDHFDIRVACSASPATST